MIKTLQDNHDAFYVSELGDIIRKYKNWKAHLSGIEPFYGMQSQKTLTLLYFANRVAGDVTVGPNIMFTKFGWALYLKENIEAV